MCRSKKITNVILNSNNAISGTVNSNLNYYIDWSSILKDNTPYELHWCYVGQANKLTEVSKLAQVQINFQMENYFNKKDNVVGVPNTFTIGVLRSAYLNGVLNTLYAGDNDNPPIYLSNRPLYNSFNIQVLTNDATPVAWVDNATIPVPNGNYVLTLCFIELEKE